jgi:hypothetical protein
MSRREVSESSSSDEEWDDNITIDTSELGQRASTRKRRKVTYTMDDDFDDDVSQDEEELGASQKQAKQVSDVITSENRCPGICWPKWEQKLNCSCF